MHSGRSPGALQPPTDTRSPAVVIHSKIWRFHNCPLERDEFVLRRRPILSGGFDAQCDQEGRGLPVAVRDFGCERGSWPLGSARIWPFLSIGPFGRKTTKCDMEKFAAKPTRMETSFAATTPKKIRKGDERRGRGNYAQH